LTDKRPEFRLANDIIAALLELEQAKLPQLRRHDNELLQQMILDVFSRSQKTYEMLRKYFPMLPSLRYAAYSHKRAVVQLLLPTTTYASNHA
jgi:hypothetical protein